MKFCSLTDFKGESFYVSAFALESFGEINLQHVLKIVDWYPVNRDLRQITIVLDPTRAA